MSVTKNADGTETVKGSPADAPRSMLEEALYILAYLVLTTGPITLPSTLEMRKALKIAKDSGLGFFKVPTGENEEGWELEFKPTKESNGTVN